MLLNKVVGLLDKIFKPPIVVFHRIGGWVLAAMMFLTAADVIGRNTLNKPIIGTFDLTEYMMAIMVTAGLAYVALTKSQINADVIITRLPLKVQRVLNIITDFFGLLIIWLFMWHSFVNMKATYGFGLKSSVLYIPVYPFMGIVAFGFVLTLLISLRNFIELFQEVKK